MTQLFYLVFSDITKASSHLINRSQFAEMNSIAYSKKWSNPVTKPRNFNRAYPKAKNLSEKQLMSNCSRLLVLLRRQGHGETRRRKKNWGWGF